VKTRPPFRVTLLSLAVLTLTVWNLFRAWTGFAWWGILAEFAPKPGPLYIGLTGVLWSALGLVLVWGLDGGRAWAPRLALGAGPVYTIWYWTDRLVLQTERANWPFILFVNLLVFVLIYLSYKSDFFQREAYERQPENQAIE